MGIVLEFLDGRRVYAEAGRALVEVLGESLDEGVVGAFLGGELFDLHTPIDRGGSVRLLRVEDPESLEILRHTASHVLAQAVKRLYPRVRLGIGPAVKDGFYYDIDFPESISEEDLPKIEEEMRRIVDEDLPIARREMSKEEAKELFESLGEIYKLELIEEIEAESVSVYQQGEFVDLCRGPHLRSTGQLKHFKLTSIAGAYWRGDEKRRMLTRVYGTAFWREEDLREHLEFLEEARRRDHRRLGKELDIFSIQPEGPGFPFFHPNGMAILNQLLALWRREHVRRGYKEIRTPVILDKELWVVSGHWDHYRDNMYFTEIDGRSYAIKPMNCPGGILVYKSKVRSYRDLPLKFAELGLVHRHERSGVLHGLMRVRCFTQDDAHIYVTPEQIEREVAEVIKLVDYFYSRVFGFSYFVELSTRPENAMGDPQVWEVATNGLKGALERLGMSYTVREGEGAFYGPKIDFHLRDCIGRTWQCGTIQLDFLMPRNFGITYVGPDGKEHTPVMIHRTVLGSLERFLGILIEHYAGAFPFWLAPVQVVIVPVRETHWERARELHDELTSLGYRVEVDSREETLGKRIRAAEMSKVPYALVLGDREVASGGVSVRKRGEGDLGYMSFDGFLELLKGEFSPFGDDKS